MRIRNVTALPVLAAATGLLLTLPAPATAAPHRVDGTRHQPAVESPLRPALAPIVAAGAVGAAGIVTDGRHVRAEAVGLADVRGDQPMRPDLNFRVGSVTKPMVATVVLQLVGEGRLALTDTVGRWLPGILPYADQVTIRHLLTMSSGVPEYLRGQIVIDLHTTTAGRFRSWAPRELVALVADRPPRFAPGTRVEYSNTNYVLAGLIVEAATGAGLAHELRRRVFRPAGLRDTSAPVDGTSIAGRNAHGYSLPLDPQTGPVEIGEPEDFTEINPSFAWAAGNVVSDLGDLTRYLSALLGGRLLPPALLTEMKTPVSTDEPDVGYGLGLEVITTPCGRVMGHNGAIAGFHTMVLSTEDGRRQVAVMVNQYFLSRAALAAFDRAVLTLMARLFPGQTCSRELSTALRTTSSITAPAAAPASPGGQTG
ncbi:MAG TPA: serine hydrolase domain-containing protein [Micromonosporaceae bacterium]|nr:serine hydrolase domain-containing protein [Micromonosporaceae bacterium]